MLVSGLSRATWVPALETEGSEPLFSLNSLFSWQAETLSERRKTGTPHSRLLSVPGLFSLPPPVPVTLRALGARGKACVS